MTVDVVIIIGFLLANLFIGFLSSKKIKGFDNFSVGDRSFSSFLIFCTLSATFIGGGYTLGNAAKVYSGGMVFAFALLGFSLKEVLVAAFVAPRMDRFRDCHSVGDMIEKSYGVRAKQVTGVFSVLVCGGILGAQVGALSAIIRVTLGINPVVGVLIAFAVLLTYATLGGMRAVVFTDTLQFLILVIGIPLTFFIGLKHVGGWQHVVQTVPHSYLHFLSTPKEWMFFLLMFVTFMFGETLVPPYVQRLFMAKSSKETFKGTLWSGIVSIPIFLLCGGIGLVAYTYNAQLSPNDALPVLVNNTLSVGFRGLVIAALLAIILSSAAGFLNAAAISFVNDLVKPMSRHPGKVNFLLMARLSTLLVGLIALVFALLIHNVLDILLAAYNFWSPIILVPLLMVIFQVKAKARDFFAGSLAGIVGALLWQYGFSEPWGVSPILFGITCNGLAFWLSKRLSFSAG